MVGFVAVFVISEFLQTHQVVNGKSGIPAHTPHLKGGLLKALAYKTIFIFYYYALAINAGDDDASLPLSAESYLFTLW